MKMQKSEIRFEKNDFNILNNEHKVILKSMCLV